MSSNGFAFATNTQAQTNTGSLQKALWLSEGQVGDLGKTQVPALVQFGRLGFLPYVVQLSSDENFDVDTHSRYLTIKPADC